jgi:hypothetical protein
MKQIKFKEDTWVIKRTRDFREDFVTHKASFLAGNHWFEIEATTDYGYYSNIFILSDNDYAEIALINVPNSLFKIREMETF